MNEFIDLAEKSEAAREKAEQDEARRREEVVQSELIQQVEEGRCNIVPMPNVATRPFRAELYTESLPLFVSSSYKGESWTYERTLKHPATGEPILDQVLVGRTGSQGKERGVLRQAHQECWYRLLKLWDEQGYALETANGDTMGVLKLSQYQLVMALTGEDSSKAYLRAQELLADLSGIPIRRSQSYQWQGHSDRAKFTLIGDVTWVSKGANTEGPPRMGDRANVTISFSSFVTEQFLRKHVKQLLLTPYLELSAPKEGRDKKSSKGGSGRRSALAPLLYSKLDRELANKDRYHIRLKALFAELGMASYRYKSKRKEKIASSLERLNGKPIVGEKYKLRVSLRASSDGTDFVLEAERSAPQMILPGFDV